MSAEPRRRILLLNAALNGDGGNTGALLRRARAALETRAEVAHVTLAAGASYADVRGELQQAHGILVGTGTHWDSWTHLLQRLLEDATPDEGTELWLGKPAAVLVTMHSVGGKGVLTRLQGVLNSLGCLIPPMSGMVYSLVNQATLREGGPGADDIWSPEDVGVVTHNLLVALGCERDYRAWPVDRVNYAGVWLQDA